MDDEHGSVCHLHSSELSVGNVVDLSLRMEILGCREGILSVEEGGVLKVFRLSKERSQAVLEHLSPVLSIVLDKKTQSCVNLLADSFESAKFLKRRFINFMELNLAVEVDLLDLIILPAAEIISTVSNHLYGYSIERLLRQARKLYFTVQKENR